MKLYKGMKVRNTDNGNICTLLKKEDGQWLVEWQEKRIIRQRYSESELLKQIRDKSIIVVTNGLHMIKHRHNL